MSQALTFCYLLLTFFVFALSFQTSKDEQLRPSLSETAPFHRHRSWRARLGAQELVEPFCQWTTTSGASPQPLLHLPHGLPWPRPNEARSVYTPAIVPGTK